MHTSGKVHVPHTRLLPQPSEIGPHAAPCSAQVFGKGASATDNSLIGTNRSLIAENNYGYRISAGDLTGGATTPGLNRIDVVKKKPKKGKKAKKRKRPAKFRCRSVWTSQERAPSVVPKLSLSNGLVYTYTHPQRSDGIEEVLERICTTLARSFGFERVVMHRYYETTNEVSPLVAHGRDGFARPNRFPIEEEPLLESVLRAQNAVYIEDAGEEQALSETVLEAYRPTSIVCAPLLVEGRCLGFMSADQGGRHFTFSDEALRTLETFSAITAVFLEKALDQTELERLNEIKSRFVALASHELRTPAASIYGAAVTLERRSGELEDGQLRALHHLLYEQSNRLRILVGELLDLSRLDSGSVPMHPETLGLLPRLERLVRELFSERVDDVFLDVPEELSAHADPQAFDRIVSNLLSNAFRYGDPPVRIAANSRSITRVADKGKGTRSRNGTCQTMTYA